MGRSAHESITSLPAAPADERRGRMLEYTVMMSIRVLCIISLIWVRGWWLVIPAAGAIFLPYFAVVVANAVRPRAGVPERPGSILPASSGSARSGDSAPAGSAPDDSASAGSASDGSAPAGTSPEGTGAPQDAGSGHPEAAGGRSSTR